MVLTVKFEKRNYTFIRHKGFNLNNSKGQSGSYRILFQLCPHFICLQSRIIPKFASPKRFYNENFL